MSRFMRSTVSDMRAGHDTWRVIVALCVPAFALAVAMSLAHSI